MSANSFEINLGGEGEQPGVLNQQTLEVARPTWWSVDGRTFFELVQAGLPFLLCPNEALALPDECVDIVYTNSVQVDVATWRGPGVQSSEIRRILKSSGIWVRDGVLYYTKP